MALDKSYKGPRPRVQMSIRFDPETIEFLDTEALHLSAKPPFRDITASDVVRYAIKKYREDHSPAAPPPPRPKCDIIETEGGTFCTHCGSRAEKGVNPKCRNGGSN